MTPQLVVAASNCTNCIQPWVYPTFDMEASKNLKTNGTEIEIYFASMTNTVKALEVTDDVCLAARLFKVCAYDVEFSVIDDSNINIPDGLNIFGIAPRSLTEGPSFIDLLYEQGMIKQSMAVLYINS